MLKDTFPEIFDKQTGKEEIYSYLKKFKVDINYTEVVSNWEDVNNRRNFLTSFAGNMGFDPAVAANWQTVLLPQLRAHGV